MLAQTIRSLRPAVSVGPLKVLSTKGIGARTRVVIYAAVVATIGSLLSFVGLGAGMVIVDEASFAYTTDTMLKTGDYVTLRIDELDYHLNAAPLYNWLTCLTFDWGWPGEMRYRVWSGVFGVLCGTAVLVLGAVLFGPEVGLIAALVLLLNYAFLFQHGIRFGGMETGASLFITCLVICYVRTHQVAARQYLWWGAMGACLGGAVLTKPPAFAGFFFALLCAHNTVLRRDVSFKNRLLYPAVAVAVAVAVAGPWYAALTARVGPRALQALFVYNSIERAAKGNYPHPPTYYLEVIRGSSATFAVVVELVVLAVGAVLMRLPGRFGLGLMLLLSLTFLTAISISSTKHQHYCYYALPFLSTLAAAVFAVGLGPTPWPGPRGRIAWRVLAVGGVAAAVVLLGRDAVRDWDRVRSDQFDYPPLLFHGAMTDQLAAGRVRLVAVGYPDGTVRRDRTRTFTPTERYYHQFHLEHCDRPKGLPEVNAGLGDGVPTVVFLPPLRDISEPVSVELACRPDRYALLRSGLYFYPVLLFHGVDRVCDLDHLMKKVSIGEAPPPVLTLQPR